MSAARAQGRSKAAFTRACRSLVGGVNSPVRAFNAVGGHPRFVARGQASRIWDIDGREYVDLVLSWGPLLLGHADPDVLRVMRQAASHGTTFGAPTEAETELAELIKSCLPSIQKVRLVSSGTEAVMGALRAARGFTGRDVIVKFEGCYHGHADHLLVEAGSGAATLGVPSSRGVPAAVAALTWTLPYNDLTALRALMRSRGRKIAAVIVEPIAGNMGVVPPAPGFLETLRRETSRAGALLVFDEVITGFRVEKGGAQGLYGIEPDLTCLGKTVGGGMPLGAYGGRADVMSMVSPEGPVYQAGTLSGNPVAVAAGLALLKKAIRKNIWSGLDRMGSQLEQALCAVADEAGVPLRVQRVGSMLTPFFTADPVTDFASARRTDNAKFKRAFHRFLDAGVWIPPSSLEAWFISSTHSTSDIRHVREAALKAFA